MEGRKKAAKTLLVEETGTKAAEAAVGLKVLRPESVVIRFYTILSPPGVNPSEKERLHGIRRAVFVRTMFC
jgi:hypothetical protein